MRFKRCVVTKEPYAPNPTRRLMAAKKYIDKEKSKIPMLAEQMVTETPEDRVNFLDEASRRWAMEFRGHTAETWWRCRRALQQLPAEKRKAIIQEWNNTTWLPASCEYFADFLHQKGIL